MSADLDPDDPPVVALADVAAALIAGEEFFVPAPLGTRGVVRAGIREAASSVGLRALVGPAWGRYPYRYGGDYLHVMPYRP